MTTTAPPVPVYDAKLVGVNRLQPHPHQIRDDLGDLGDLIASMKALGQLEPVLIEPDPDRPRGYYLILAGERRWRAAQAAGHKLVLARQMDRQGLRGAIMIMLGENGPREPINAMDCAMAFGALIADGMTQAQIAAGTGYSASFISSHLTLLELDVATQERVRRGVKRGGVSATDAVAAVRETRKVHRHQHGHSDPGQGVVREPDYFTARHPLAKDARVLCAAAGHRHRRKYGRVACGECWETVIRRSERNAPQVPVVAA